MLLHQTPDSTRLMNDPNIQLHVPWVSQIPGALANHIKLQASIPLPLFRIIPISIQVFWDDTCLPEIVHQYRWYNISEDSSDNLKSQLDPCSYGICNCEQPREYDPKVVGITTHPSQYIRDVSRTV